MLTTNKGYNGIYTSTQMVIPHRDIAIEIPMGWTMSWPMTGESAACCCLNGISSSLVVVVVCHAADMDWRSNWFIVLAQHPCAVLDSFDAAGVPIRTCLEWSPCCLYVFVQSIAAVSGMPVSSSIRLAFTYQQMHTSHNEQSAHTPCSLWISLDAACRPCSQVSNVQNLVGWWSKRIILPNMLGIIAIL